MKGIEIAEKLIRADENCQMVDGGSSSSGRCKMNFFLRAYLKSF